MKKELRILMLNYEFPPLGGGAGNANYYLLKEFAKKKNVHIDLVTSSANNKFETEHFSSNIKIFKLNVNKKDIHYWKMNEIIRWTKKAYKFSKELINKNEYDLCHCWTGWPAGIIGYKLRKQVPYIIALRGSDVPGYSSRLKILDKIVFSSLSKLVWKNAKFVITNSEGLKKLALKTFNTKIDVIYNGVDVDEFKPLKNKKIGKKIKLISTGRLIERKGYNYLIEALKVNNNIELTLIGEGNLKKELEDLAKKNKVNVKFLGRVNHKLISNYLRNADIFILPSLNEGMSNSILEAMACGLPIITTDVGGSKELIKDNGFIVKKADSETLKYSIEKFLNNPKLIKQMGNTSKKIAKKMNWNNITKKYLEIYNEKTK